MIVVALVAIDMIVQVRIAGALNPNVTQANIAQTICRPGWTATVRPSTSYTDRLKRKQMLARGLPGPASAYEEDHFIPLELGGHPTSPLNLWPQPWARTDACNAHNKDIDEHAYRRAVCRGLMKLAVAQQRMSDKWKKCKAGNG